MYHALFLHVFHIFGKRMQHQGTNGLSRGDLTSGFLQGDHLLSFIPLHHGAWLTTDHQVGCHVWCPPPATADVALEQATITIDKRP
jgi:hypothetical protein